ncbi:MAG: folate-binding protein [Betaproteobacteria bacterium]|nr:MAG: folate-binding protein [Betaproteobacteria bacterium]
MGTMLNEQWTEFLRDAGASPEGAGGRAFRGDTGLQSPLTGCFVCDLSGYAVAAFSGPDAESFLHGQLSSDVRALLPGRSQLAAYNTPKGRILAVMLLWRDGDRFLAQMPASIGPGVLKRLSMYILRSKVTATDVSGSYVRIGLGGPAAARAAAGADIRLPAEDFELLRNHGTESVSQPDFIMTLPSGRYELLYSDVQAAMAGWNALCTHGAQPSGAGPWHWLSIRSGIAEIGAETQDRFVPQMLNLELVGGVSFTKGCYPGQEIVARAQYRGEIKRRTFLAHLEAEMPPAVGQDVVNADAPGQSIGTIVTVASAPGGGYDALVCLHIDLARDADLRLGDSNGPRLECLDLPYILPELSRPCA